jgi:hypothetical protein
MKDQKSRALPSFDEAEKTIKKLGLIIKHLESDSSNKDKKGRPTLVVDEFQVVGQAWKSN